MNKIVIGIDQSYADTGITAIRNNTDILFCSSKKREKNHTDYRYNLKLFLLRKLENLCKISDDITVIVERIGIRANHGGLSQVYVKNAAALISCIIDACYVYDIDVYSVDTRVWKYAIVGTCKSLENKYDIAPEKYPTIQYIRQSGLLKYIVDDYAGKGTKGVINVKKRGEGYVKMKVNDNRADSICIAQYGFLPEEKKKLQLERF